MNNAEKKIPLSYARKFGVFCRDENEQLQLVYRPDTKPSSIAEARRFIGLESGFRMVTLDQSQFEEALNDAYQQDSNEAMRLVQGMGDELDLDSLASSLPQAEDLLSREDDAPIIRLINAILGQAVKQGASDVHLETYEKSLAVRFRIDGVLQTAVQPQRELAPLLVSRVKVMAKLDIAEKRVPQDGRMTVRVSGRDVDVRVSTLPSSYGERVVLRLLDKNNESFSLDAIGMEAQLLQHYRSLVRQPHGIILVAGPTGSGKSTTLYASLSEINDQSQNILTIEDPIEYNLEGIGQSQVNSKAGLDFARGLRAMLRQDPDVVMVGEIRDRETAEIAVQASLTGHLVLSTLHTNSAAGSVTRLKDMGVEPFLLSSSLLGVLAQRLVRTLCNDCKIMRPADVVEKQFLGVASSSDIEISHSVGCESCRFSGYKGRIGIYELFRVDETARQLIHSGASEADLREASGLNTTNLLSCGKQKVLDHETTVEEVIRVTQSL